MKLAIKMHEQDNVATAMEALRAGEEVSILSERGAEVDRLAARMDAPLPYHKVALVALAVGDALVKYGEVIGYATAPIARGDWVHLHNLRSAHFAAAREDAPDGATTSQGPAGASSPGEDER